MMRPVGTRGAGGVATEPPVFLRAATSSVGGIGAIENGVATAA